MTNDRTFHHQHAHKLDDPERLTWLPPGEVVSRLGLFLGARIADVGAGTGYFARPLAEAVGGSGWVAAVDLQPEMLALLAAKPLDATAAPITAVLGTAVKTGLPSGLFDLVFLGNVWHELDDLDGVISESLRLLRAPAGRMAVLDWRSDVSQPPGPPLAHRIAAQEVVKRLEAHGLQAFSEPVGTYSYLVMTR